MIDTLLRSDEPSVRWKVRVGALGEDPESKASASTERSRLDEGESLLAHHDESGRLGESRNVYAKWQGAHWILATLADLGYPERDEALSSCATRSSNAG